MDLPELKTHEWGRVQDFIEQTKKDKTIKPIVTGCFSRTVLRNCPQKDVIFHIECATCQIAQADHSTLNNWLTKNGATNVQTYRDTATRLITTAQINNGTLEFRNGGSSHEDGNVIVSWEKST